TRSLVTEHPRRRNSAVLYLLNVRWTDAANSHFHEQFIGLDLGNRKRLDSQIVWSVINDRAHLFRNLFGHAQSIRESGQARKHGIEEVLQEPSGFGLQRWSLAQASAIAALVANVTRTFDAPLGLRTQSGNSVRLRHRSPKRSCAY